MRKVAKIRNRGRLTIPISIRKIVPWLSPKSIVLLSVSNSQEIIVRPYEYKKEVDWDKIWKMIKNSRSRSVTGKMSTAKFLEKDRKSH